MYFDRILSLSVQATQATHTEAYMGANRENRKPRSFFSAYRQRH